MFNRTRLDPIDKAINEIYETKNCLKSNLFEEFHSNNFLWNTALEQVF